MKRSLLRIPSVLCMHLLAVLFSVGTTPTRAAEQKSIEHVPPPPQEETIPAAASTVDTKHDSSTDDANTKEDPLRRKRSNEQQQQQQHNLNRMWEGTSEGATQALMTAAESTFGAVADNLEELWDRESARAASEVERMLQGAIGSMPSPTRGPISMVPVTMMPVAPTTSTPSTTGTASPTSTPDTECLMGRSPEQYLLDELLQITNVNLLLDPSTPQGMAFNFILDDETVRRNLCGYPTIAQRYGLGKFLI